MCGICGIVESGERRPDPVELESMMACLAHRGPDDQGMRIDGRIGMGQRRLSIIDLSSAGRQPMSNEDGTVWIVYNGEFYNYRQYTAELERDGHVFRSRSDTEVIIHLYEKYGLDGTIRRMMGMFAFFLWDKRTGKRYLVRDRLGIKPLYWYRGLDRLAFASEVKAFYPLRGFQPRLDNDNFISMFLFNKTRTPSTLLENIQEVPPGHWLEMDDDRVRPVRYYDLSHVQVGKKRSERDALEEFDERLTVSIRRRLVSDVPVGVFLSGGVDSTILALKTAEITGRPINTISVAYPEEAGNEFPWSDQVAARIGSIHHKSVVSSEDFFQIYPWITYIFDEPVCTGAAFFKAARVAKDACTVMLCGQGSDEIFGGYSRYIHANRQVRINRLLSMFLPQNLVSALSAKLASAGNGKLFRKVIARMYLSPGEVAAAYASGLREEDFRRMVAGSSRGLYLDQLRRYGDEFPAGDSFLNNMLEKELSVGLQEILQQTDRLTMAAAVETRVPFLDHELVEFAFSLPEHMKVRDGVGKWLLKRYLLRHFPPEFVMRPKMGFPTPIYQWFMDPKNAMHKLLAEGLNSEIAGRFNLPYIRHFMERVREGKIGRTADVLDPLMKFLAFTVWWKTIRRPDWAVSHRPPEAEPLRMKASTIAKTADVRHSLEPRCVPVLERSA